MAQFVRGDAFDEYSLVGTFTVPPGSGFFDALPDGRLVFLKGSEVFAETAPRSRTFDSLGELPDADIGSFGAAFVRVSPSGTQIAIGNNGGSSFNNYEVGAFDFPGLTGRWLLASHYDGEWFDDRYLALTTTNSGEGYVTILDTESTNADTPFNRAVVGDIGGYSGGVTFDSSGNLYTANGFSTTGPSGTGTIKGFSYAAWSAALEGDPPLDFENEGSFIADVLSGSPLAFDLEQNLFVGGGDFGSGDFNSVAILHNVGQAGVAVISAFAERRLDPDYAEDFNFYYTNTNPQTGEFYVRDLSSNRVYEFGRAFASEVMEYSPAPGHFVQNGAFNHPDIALGPPQGLGTYDGNATSIVTLGGFGGSLTLAFDHTVEDDPLNPFGIDAIVFGNAIWVTDDPNFHWAECAFVEIARDSNGNGHPDDPLFLIPGSHITNLSKQYSIQTWDDNTSNAIYPPADESWIPPGKSGTWMTDGYLLPAAIFGQGVVVNPQSGGDTEGIFGYADYSPTLILGDTDGDNDADDTTLTAEQFYTVPDDPLSTGVTPGSGGGDGFDIAWAVDPNTGLPANLDGFDFLRITNGVSSVLVPYDEISTEIDAVADVRRDPIGDFEGDGDIDMLDFAQFEQCFFFTNPAGPPCTRFDRNADVQIDLIDGSSLIRRISGPK